MLVDSEGCFRFLTVVNSVSVNTADVSPTYADQRIFVSFGYRPGSESVLGQTVAPFLTF